MRYDFNGKTIAIPDADIEKLMKSLELSKQDAIDLWLCDNGYDEDEEQTELDEKASKVHITKEVSTKKSTKPRKPIEKKVSDEKKALFSEILNDLKAIYGDNAEVLNENKLISVRIGDKCFKIDVIQVRTPSLDKKK